jgi:hypothetical protein
MNDMKTILGLTRCGIQLFRLLAILLVGVPIGLYLVYSLAGMLWMGPIRLLRPVSIMANPDKIPHLNVGLICFIDRQFLGISFLYFVRCSLHKHIDVKFNRIKSLSDLPVLKGSISRQKIFKRLNPVFGRSGNGGQISCEKSFDPIQIEWNMAFTGHIILFDILRKRF